MGIITDLIIAVPIGILYNQTVHKISDMFNGDLSYEDKYQKNLLFIFGGGLMGLLIAFFMLNSKTYNNRALKYGLYLGSFILFVHSVFYNWHIMRNDAKIIVLLLALSSLIWYTFSRLGNEKGESSYDESLPAIYYERYEKLKYDDFDKYNEENED